MKYTRLSIALMMAIASSSTLAETWEITQATTPGGGTVTLTELNTTTSLQAINTINSLTATVEGHQTLTMNALALQFNQQGTTGSSTQAANYLKALAINAATAAFAQAIDSTTGTLNFQQGSSGENNLQGGNIIDVVSGASVSSATQAIDTSGTVAFNQAATTGNVQAGNGVIILAGNAGGSITQNVTTGALSMLQNRTSTSTQATNYLGERR